MRDVSKAHLGSTLVILFASCYMYLYTSSFFRSLGIHMSTMSSLLLCFGCTKNILLVLKLLQKWKLSRDVLNNSMLTHYHIDLYYFHWSGNSSWPKNEKLDSRMKPSLFLWLRIRKKIRLDKNLLAKQEWEIINKVLNNWK